MFILTKIADLVQIEPKDIEKPILKVIEDNINTKYANKVIQKIGFCICLYDLLWTSEGLIGHGDGYVNVNVEFRLIVFRPFKGEVIFARVSSCRPNGICLRTEFFHDIFVPYDELPEGAEYDMNRQVWAWNFDDLRMYYDHHERVRLRVIDEEWHDQTPTKPIERGRETEEPLVPPYTIKATMKEFGLGVYSWWD